MTSVCVCGCVWLSVCVNRLDLGELCKQRTDICRVAQSEISAARFIELTTVKLVSLASISCFNVRQKPPNKPDYVGCDHLSSCAFIKLQLKICGTAVLYESGGHSGVTVEFREFTVVFGAPHGIEFYLRFSTCTEAITKVSQSEGPDVTLRRAS